MYLIFAGNTYYPEGGADDFFCVCGTLEQAQERVMLMMKNKCADWAHAFCTEKKEVVFRKRLADLK